MIAVLAGGEGWGDCRLVAGCPSHLILCTISGQGPLGPLAAGRPRPRGCSGSQGRGGSDQGGG